MSYQIELTEIEPIHTAVIRERVQPEDLARFVPAACGEVWSYVRSAGLPKPGRHVAMYLGHGAVEVGVEVTEPFAGNDRVHCSQIPSGRVASTVHLGPYQRLGEAHKAVRDWCTAQGHQCSGVSWEIYDHWQEGWNEDPDQIRTEVYCLLDDPHQAADDAADVAG